MVCKAGRVVSRLAREAVDVSTDQYAPCMPSRWHCAGSGPAKSLASPYSSRTTLAMQTSREVGGGAICPYQTMKLVRHLQKAGSIAGVVVNEK